MTDDPSVSGQIAELVALGDSLFASGNIDDAENIFSALSQISPHNFQVLKALGVIAATKRDYGRAAILLSEAAGLKGDDPLVWNVLSVCRFQAGDYVAALACADAALKWRRRFAEAHNSRGNALHRLGRNEEALEAFKEALAHGGEDPEVLINQANVILALGRPQRALETIDRAIALNPAIPEAHRNRGNVLHDLDRAEEALESYDRAISLNPRMDDAYAAKGNVLKSLCRFKEAVENYDKALALNDALDMIHFNRSHCNLLLGHFDLGWRQYERRWSDATPGLSPSRKFPAPLWLGEEPLENKAILLHCEQGFGDAIQFVRYASDLIGLGATVYLEAFEPLIGLFREIPNIAGVIPRGASPPSVDFHCPLMSLPLALSNLGVQPAATFPYLKAPAAATARWRSRLARNLGVKVGVTCSGNSLHTNDQNRSLALSLLTRALPAGPAYFLIQKEPRADDEAALRARPDLIFLGDDISDFADTAAICQQMDLVVTVDTSLAHLAGALNRPTWILLPHEPDWRWRLEAETTPWYPSVKLYRQAVRRDWSSALERVGCDLRGV